MLWHTDSWPGRLGLLCSPDQSLARQCLVSLAKDFQVFLEAAEVAKSDVFLLNLVKQSPFSTTLMREMGELALASPDPANDPGLLAVLKSMATSLWKGWGTSALVEHGFKELRDRESRDTTNSVLEKFKQWDVLRSRGVMEADRRQEITASESGPALGGSVVGKELFNAASHQPSVEALHLTKRRDWVSFSGHSLQVLAPA
eukprot:2727255-Lingulodinium_polyedra.AAC.1